MTKYEIEVLKKFLNEAMRQLDAEVPGQTIIPGYADTDESKVYLSEEGYVNINTLHANIKHEHPARSYVIILKGLFGDRYEPNLGDSDGMVKNFTIQDFYKLVEEVGWVIITGCSETHIDIDIYDDYIE